MTSSPQLPQGAHLVGSVPLEDNQAVFQLAGSVLGDYLHRIPDGETGERSNWIDWQLAVLSNIPQFETVPGDPDRYPPMRPTVKLRDGAVATDIEFGELGYSAAARDSYARFAQLKQDGKIPPACRFQVSLPTPLAPIHAYVAPESQAAVEPVYEAKMMTELDEIVAAVPADELAIQWDTAVEFALWEGIWPTYYDDVKSAIIERLVRLGNAVPSDVELGYHLCYGDAGHQHFVEPSDTANLVEVANAIADGLTRPLHWIHMPVPRQRSDEAYFAPLANLELPPETELYLGLVHMTDGIEGARQRIKAAQSAVSTFGVATECGFGRRPPETVPQLMEIHAAVAQPIR